jgi:hypothetical protein
VILALPVPYFEARGLGDTAQIQAQIIAEANAVGVPPSIALAVAEHESRFIPTAQNPSSSAAGLFQLMGVTQQTLGVTNPYDPTQNIDAAVPLLAKYYQQYGDWNKALQAFSDGPGTVSQGLPPSAQTLGLISYVNSYSPPSTLDISGGGSSLPDLSSAFPSLDLSSFTLPDLSGSTLIPGVPDWVTWLGAAGVVLGAVVLVNR